jgi:serine protease Do
MGALSTSVLTFADSELDFEALEWRIHPEGIDARPGYEMLPSLIERARPGAGASPIFIDAAIGGQNYRLQADTGSPAPLHLWPRAVRRSGLWDSGRPFAPVRPGGIGGEGERGRVMRVGAVGIGGLSFPGMLAVADNPRTASTHRGDGLIGLPLLQRMNLSTDLRRSRLWARANALPPPPERYGLSGLWVEPAQNGLAVVEVSPASPAAEAGLQVGDVIPGIALDAFVARLAGRPGDAVEINYRRGREMRRTRLTLRAFL